jgi:DNA polymerase-3 subunit epsilon
MKLTRPLAFFDIEGTGTDVAQDRIVSIAIIKVMPDGSRKEYYQLCNPGFQMAEEVIAIHGITNAEAAKHPPFKAIAPAVVEFIHGCDLGGYNCNNYDVPILVEELTRCGIDLPLDGIHIVDVGNVFKKKEERTLAAALLFYVGRELKEAHNALADTDATRLVLDGQLAFYDDLKAMSVEELAKFSKMDDRADLTGKLVYDKDGDVVYNIGKSKGTKIKHDPSFAEWMLGKDFSSQTKAVLRRELDKIYGVQADPEDEHDHEPAAKSEDVPW